MKIAMITSEANPLSKSGGLADVAYSLSRELNKFGEEAIIITPFYGSTKGKNYSFDYVGYFYVDMAWRHQYVGVYKTLIDGINYYLLDNEYYFARDNLYGYDDDNERFAYFSLAALELLKYISFKADIVHIHDWQGGMIPCLIKEKYYYDSFYSDMHSVLTIHNPAFKGLMDRYYLNNYFGLSDELFDNGKVRFEGLVSTLKAAIVYADKISTVSPTHRNELLSHDFAQGLEAILRLREDDFVGIINGLDIIEFDPEKDDKIVCNFSLNNFTSGKKNNKKELFKHFRLKYSDSPTFGLVSRLTYQKGLNLVFENAEYLLSRGAYLFILGSGEKELEREFEHLRSKYNDRIGIYIGYNDLLAHKIYAGSDFFLMPSLFEPCGIGQLIAQRYATLPIVRRTGGLADTVIGYDENNLLSANGFSFNAFYGLALGEAINQAFDVYYDKEKLKTMRLNALKLDRSWNNSMQQYINLYKEAIKK